MFKYNQNINSKVNNNNLILECYVRNKGENNVAWLFEDQILSVDGLLIKSNANIEIDTNKEDKFNLKFNNLSISQRGLYKCQITTLNAINLVYNLDVLYPPIVTRTPNNQIISVREGETININCQAHGNPKPKISWPSNIVCIKKVKLKSCQLKSLNLIAEI